MYNFEGFEVDMNDNLDLDDERLQYIRYAINIGQEFDVSVSGTSFLGFGTRDIPVIIDGEVGHSREVSGNIYTTLNELYITINALSDLNIDSPEILHKNVQPFMTRLQQQQNDALAQLAEVGGRIARMDLMMDRYIKDEINYTQMKSDVEDLDMAEALMWFSMTEAVYRASLGVGGRILPPSLVDFLR
jgi:flagellar hook-associated protein 3 FlgL